MKKEEEVKEEKISTYEEFSKKFKTSDELNQCFDFIKNEVLPMYPSYTIGVEHLIYAIFSNEFTIASRCAKWILKDEYEANITELIKAYAMFLSKKSVGIMRPNAKIKYSEDLIDLLETSVAFNYDTDATCTTLSIIGTMMTYSSDSKSNLDEVNTDKILNDKDKDLRSWEISKKVLTKFGITLFDVINYKYKSFNGELEETKEDKSIEIKDNNQKAKEELDKILKLTRNKNITVTSSSDNKNKNSGSFVEQYCVNLKELVCNGTITKIYGREYELKEIIRVLGRKKKNNAILVGDGGVGKTAIVEGLAYNIYHNINIPEFLIDKEIVSLNMTAVFAGTTLRGMFEERIFGLLEEIKKSNKYILFIDDIGNALSDKQKNDYELSSMLSKSLENGDLNVIGTCDFKSYRKTFDKDVTLARRFQKIVVEKPTIPEAISMIKESKAQYEQFHNVHFSDELIKSLVNLVSTYVTDRNLPDSAIDIIDEAGSQFGRLCEDNKLLKMKQEILNAETKIRELKDNDDYKAADNVTKELKSLRTQYTKRKKETEEYKKQHPTEITIDNILGIISEITKIPVSQLNSNEKKKLNSLNERLKNSIIGQDENIDIICKAIKRNRIGLRNTGCMYSALLIGQTGVGKTLTAKKLAREMFGSEDAIIRFDMSEYTDSAAVSKLIGSNPGYIGYEDGGLLTEAVKNKKYCVLLLDEIEKADSEIYNIFLQVLDEGFLTDNTGMKIDFKNVIVLFTSNVGAKKASEFKRGIGFFSNEEENAKHIFANELKNTFTPEFLNRIDNVIYFNPLNKESLEKIIVLEMNNLKKRLNNINFDMSWSNKVIEHLHKQLSSDTEYGARPIKRMIQDNIEDKITDILISNDFDKHTFKVNVNKKEEITVS